MRGTEVRWVLNWGISANLALLIDMRLREYGGY